MPPKDSQHKKRFKPRKSQPKPNSNRETAQTGKQPDTYLYGLHSVEAALKNPDRVIRRLRATRNAAAKIQNALSLHKVSVDITDVKELDKILGADVVHQGVLLEADPLPVIDLDDLSGRSPVLVLDQVTDPHNVGAILRSASAFGVGALIMTARNSPPLCGALAKIASGGLEHTPICLVGNLAQALGDLGKAGYWRYGLDGEGEECLEDQKAAGPVVLVLGAEGKGLRRLTMENCDQIVKIKTAGSLTSLNVSNAAAISLHSIFLSNEQSS